MKIQNIVCGISYMIYCILNEVFSINYRSLHHKRSYKNFTHKKVWKVDNSYFCGTPYEPVLPVIPVIRQPTDTPFYGKLTFRISIYYDKLILSTHDNNVQKLKNFLYAIVNSVFLSFNQNNFKSLANFSLAITRFSQIPNSVRITDENNGDLYVRNFCNAVKLADNTGLMTAVLFTGHNIRGNKSKSLNIQGLARLKTACKWNEQNCILVEARSYLAAYILAHELGHILGMNHDEDIKCGSNNIMSVTTGAGKTKFSECSAIQLTYFLHNLIRHKYWCLDYNPYESLESFPSLNNFVKPYHSVSADDQCKQSHGDSYRKLEAIDNHICDYTYCTNDIINLPSHPALENTRCGHQKVCREGDCVRE